MADKKISQLDLAAQINNDAVIPMSQENGGEQTTYKALITAVAAKIGEGTTFSNLNTNAKNLVGAINEIEAGGGGGGSSNANLAPDYDSTSTYAVGDWCIYNGTLYQCNTAIPTAEAFDPTHWTAKKVVDAFADIEDELDDKVNTTDFLATNLPISSSDPMNTKDYIDTGLSGKADSSDLPIWIKQAVGTSVSFAVPCTFFYYYADQWRAYVQFPFIAKNNNYSISLTSVQAENIGDITSKISVIAKYGACFEIETTKTMTALPNQFSVCVGTVNFTITFA